jgi:hypothetical protein
LKALLLILVLGGLLAVSAVGAYQLWVSMEGVELSIHGMIALIGGLILTFLVGGGLMLLVFISSRSGHDQRASDGEGVEPRYRK